MKSIAIRFMASSLVACSLCLHGEAADAGRRCMDTAAVNAAEAKMAAEKNGGAEAQFQYAEMLRDGRGVAKSMREAVRWTRKAADAGHAHAQCQMGLFYMNAGLTH